MKLKVRLIAFALFLLVALDLVLCSKTQPTPKKAAKPANSKKRNPGAWQILYGSLRPEQKQLVDDYIRRYNATPGSKLMPEQAYDGARLSVRTTFDAVTHALLNAKLSRCARQEPGCCAIELVDAVDEVMGEQSGVGGDRQFRLYVGTSSLSNAVDILSRSQEFFRDRDNSVYHKGFPICLRLKNGPPSIQFSISLDQKLSDIDVDYRASASRKVWLMDTCPLPTRTSARETTWIAMTAAGRASTAGGATSLDSSGAAASRQRRMPPRALATFSPIPP